MQSTVQLEPLAARLCELELKACALTDYANMYGAVSFYNAMADNGIQPIVGYEAYLRFGSRFDRTTAVGAGEKGYYNLILLARNLEGYRNLVHLSSRAFTEGLHYKPRIDIEILSAYSKGLICLSGGIAGPIGHFLSAGDADRASENAGILSEIFEPGRFFLEISDDDTSAGDAVVGATVALAASCDLPIVATNDVHYLAKDDASTASADLFERRADP